MLKRIAIILVGIALLGAVVYLGWLASRNATLVIWFGVSSAILAPAGFALIGFALREGENDLLMKLSKVPEIQQLIEKAQNQEEIIRALESERKHLEAVVKFEALRTTLIEQKNSLEADAVRILESMASVDDQLERMEADVEDHPDKEVIKKLRERIRSRQRGDIIIEVGSTSISFNTIKLQGLPGGRILSVYINAIAELFELLMRLENALLTRRFSRPRR